MVEMVFSGDAVVIVLAATNGGGNSCEVEVVGVVAISTIVAVGTWWW